jgi:hypothetical protein
MWYLLHVRLCGPQSWSKRENYSSARSWTVVIQSVIIHFSGLNHHSSSRSKEACLVDKCGQKLSSTILYYNENLDVICNLFLRKLCSRWMLNVKINVSSYLKHIRRSDWSV